MIYLGKLNGPRLVEVLKRQRDDFRKRKIEYYVWEKGIYIGKCIGGRNVLRTYDSAIKEAEASRENTFQPIIIIGKTKFFTIHWVDKTYLLELLIEYRPTRKEIELLGNDYQKEARGKPGQASGCVRDDAWR